MIEPKRVVYDEFSLFHENATEFGLPYDGPPEVRRESVDVGGRRLSALVWGHGEPRYVFLHGGAQNAHTWDTVAMALGEPLIAIDLPGHGHSDRGRNGSLDVTANAEDVASVVRRLAPQASAIVGMSLGGITTLALADDAPELARSIVLVDITPGVTADKSRAITAFVNGPAVFEDFDALLKRTIEHNPNRTVSSLRRGILHNAIQRPDGSWTWRYAQFARSPSDDPTDERDHERFWAALARVRVPLLLIRGMLPQSVVDDSDERELRRLAPHAKVAHFDQAGHSVQGDAPLELAAALSEFVNRDVVGSIGPIGGRAGLDR